ncbi:hypothetical protein RRG08_062778, partial [Elysia crispata]
VLLLVLLITGDSSRTLEVSTRNMSSSDMAEYTSLEPNAEKWAQSLINSLIGAGNGTLEDPANETDTMETGNLQDAKYLQIGLRNVVGGQVTGGTVQTTDQTPLTGQNMRALRQGVKSDHTGREDPRASTVASSGHSVKDGLLENDLSFTCRGNRERPGTERKWQQRRGQKNQLTDLQPSSVWPEVSRTVSEPSSTQKPAATFPGVEDQANSTAVQRFNEALLWSAPRTDLTTGFTFINRTI